MAEISIIVPVYGVESWLPRCVDSILSQAFKDFDLILVDDGSPDGSGEICDEYTFKDSRVHVVHQDNRGLSAARNAGIEWAFHNSDSHWLTFVDSDDWIHPEYLSWLYKAVIELKVAVASCGFVRTEGEDIPSIVDITSETQIPKDYYQKSCVNATVAWGKLYKKECFQNLRFPVGRLHEDEFVTYKILFAQDKIAVIDAPMYAYYQNDAGIMLRKWSPKRLDALAALEQQMAFFENRGHLDLTKKKFNKYIQENLKGQKLTVRCDIIDDKEKRRIVRELKRGLRRMLFRYHKYRWRSIWRRGNDLWIYDNAFMGVHVAHRLWRGIKKIIPEKMHSSK